MNDTQNYEIYKNKQFLMQMPQKKSTNNLDERINKLKHSLN